MAKKKGGICAPGGACYDFPGPKCAVCCFIFSFFGVIMLWIVGAILKSGYQKIQGEELTKPDPTEGYGPIAWNAYSAAIIYAVFTVTCGLTAGYKIFIRKPKAEAIDEDDL
eukprot:TRINITY_DN132_c0_g1_i1.p1 TRINITY_DN132_c0_g1~~TRINITY_DN132_c0_g1_i1.p1  ORF type:complete len:111 (+),score=27.02 TRINITY_DN132_c0_g1_i1:2-334(+)